MLRLSLFCPRHLHHLYPHCINVKLNGFFFVSHSLSFCCPLSFISQHAGLYKRLLCELGVNWLLKSINILLVTLLVKSQAGKTDECVIFLQRGAQGREWENDGEGGRKSKVQSPAVRSLAQKEKNWELFRKKKTEWQSKKAKRER